MRFQLGDPSAIEGLARHYAEHGFAILTGVSETVTSRFKPVVAAQMDASPAEFETILDPESPPVVLPIEVRRRLSRIASSPELSAALLAALEPVLLRLIGPFVHVSTTFHGQFKGGDAKPVDHGGYPAESQYVEVQGPYLLHQDFSGAAIPTSPSAMTLWTPLNTSPDWTLRLYPGSHRRGLLCNEWMKLDDPRLEALGRPVDVRAEAGTAVVFNSLVLHSSSNPGPRRRVSCDIRFFPLCGYLPSKVHALGADPLAEFRAARRRRDPPTLAAPLLEVAAHLGLEGAQQECPPGSVLNWVNYLQSALTGPPAAALPHLARFVDAEHGIDGVEPYARKFHGRPLERASLAGLLDSLRKLGSGASDSPEVKALERRVRSLDAAAA